MSGRIGRLLAIFILISSSRIAECYIMPVCSENGGVCNDQTDGYCDVTGSDDSSENTSPLFGFVNHLMEVTKTWLYDSFFGIKYEEQAKPQTYMESLMTFFGIISDDEPKSTDSSSSACNYSVFGLICAMYFGYLFLATKCFRHKKPIHKTFFIKKFVNYLAPEKEATFGEEDEELLADEDGLNDSLSCSKCWVCEQHKLSMETRSEVTIEPVEISSLPPCEVTEWER